jgi:hypothetical protein
MENSIVFSFLLNFTETIQNHFSKKFDYQKGASLLIVKLNVSFLNFVKKFNFIFEKLINENV